MLPTLVEEAKADCAGALRLLMADSDRLLDKDLIPKVVLELWLRGWAAGVERATKDSKSSGDC